MFLTEEQIIDLTIEGFGPEIWCMACGNVYGAGGFGDSSIMQMDAVMYGDRQLRRDIAESLLKLARRAMELDYRVGIPRP